MWTVVVEGWLEDTKPYNLLDYVSEFKQRFYKACDLAHKTLKETQDQTRPSIAVQRNGASRLNKNTHYNTPGMHF